MVRIVLAINALGFLIVGGIGLVSPAQLFALTGFTPDPTAMIELRGVYGGINLAVGALVASALIRDSLVRPALYAILCLTGGYVFGRGFSLVVDGIPETVWLWFMALEVVLATFAILSLKRVG